MPVHAVLRVLLTILVLTFVGSTASARALSGDETASLEATVKSFDAAMRSADYEKVADTIPPRVFAHIAKTAGMEVSALRPLMIEQMTKALAAVKIKDFSMDLANAAHKEAANGNPYVLIPTVTEMETGGQEIVAKSDTLALMDEGKWYLLRVQDAAQVTILKQVYPEFAGVEFSPGSMEAK